TLPRNPRPKERRRARKGVVGNLYAHLRRVQYNSRIAMPTEEQTYREGVKKDLQEIKELVKYTNGKVKRIIIALVLVFGILIGQSFGNAHDIIALVVSLI